MYINPFVVGILATVLVEVIAFFVAFAIWLKKNGEYREDEEQEVVL